MAEELTCAQVMARLRAWEHDEWTELFQDYFRRVVGLVRRRLLPRARATAGSEFVAESVLYSFLENHTEVDAALQSPTGLWGVLFEKALRHCKKWNERFRAAKRAADAVPLDGTDADGAALPDEVVALADLSQALTKELTTVRQRQIVTLLLSDRTYDEIAGALNISRSTVEREMRDHIRPRLDRFLQRQDA
jgi:DNA-directed RNA polymerase specialized sigma24 family protein